jgi:hypothetical protein
MIFRSDPLLAAVRMLPCARCGRIGCTQAAHSNQLRFGKGKGIKASDAAVMALCAGLGSARCHEAHDQGGRLSKVEWWELEYFLIAKTLMRLVRCGVLVGSTELLRALPPIETCSEALCIALVEHIEAGRLTVTQNA